MALRVKTTIVLLFMLALYAWMPHHAFRSYNLRGHHVDQYNLLTDSFLKGHLYMPGEVPAGLLALPDPYDPNQNVKFRYSHGLWDQSLYDGHVYLYFGVTPVVTGYLPYRLLTGGMRLPNPLAVLVYTYGAFLFATGLLFSFRRRYFKQTPDWMLLAAVVLVGGADLGCYLLSQSNIYQVAIAAGMFFALGAIYCASRAFEPTRHRSLWFVASGLCLAGAIGSRPHFAATGGLVFLVAIIALWRRGERHVSRYAALALPSGLGVFLLGFYNWARFGSFFEFGAHYQLGIINMTNTSMFGLDKVWSTLYFMLIQPPTFNKTYPWVHPIPELPKWLVKPNNFLLERVVGILVGTPFLWVMLIAVVIYLVKRKTLTPRPFPKLELAWLVISSGFLVALLSITTPTMRYLADFAGLVDILAVMAWFWADQTLVTSPRARTATRLVGVSLLVVSVVFGILFSLPPPFHYHDG